MIFNPNAPVPALISNRANIGYPELENHTNELLSKA
jgi:hypothetical protein